MGGADGAGGHAAAGAAGTRVRHRPAHHGAARPAGAAVGATRALGAAIRAGTQLPGAAEPVRRRVVQRARRPADRAARGGHRGTRRRRVPAVRARSGAGRGRPADGQVGGGLATAGLTCRLSRPANGDGPAPGRPRFYLVQPLWAPSATSAWATAKYLLLPRSRTVLTPNAAARCSASPSLTPASAATGASRISARLLFS